MSKNILFVLLIFMFTACVPEGISGPGKTTTLGYDLTKLKGLSRDKRKKMQFPIHLIVAQAGAIQPSEKLLEELRSHPDIFKEVSVLPAAPELRDFAKEVNQRDPKSLIALSRELGGDMLFLVGGQTMSTTSRTPFTLLDLTIIGYYIFPTNVVKARGNTFGAVISLKGEYLMQTIDHADSDWSLATSASRYDAKESVVDELQQDLLEELGRKFCRKISKEQKRQLQEFLPSSCKLQNYIGIHSLKELLAQLKLIQCRGSVS